MIFVLVPLVLIIAFAMVSQARRGILKTSHAVVMFVMLLVALTLVITGLRWTSLIIALVGLALLLLFLALFVGNTLRSAVRRVR